MSDIIASDSGGGETHMRAVSLNKVREVGVCVERGKVRAGGVLGELQ